MTIKVGSPLTVASTSALQQSNASQAKGVTSLIATATSPALTALGLPYTSSSLSVGSTTALPFRAHKKVSFAIDKPFESEKITAASASTVVATQTPSINELKTRLRELTFLKNRSEIAVLVELGEWAGTVDFSKLETYLLIADKINALRMSAEDFHNLASVRSDLCKLSRISSIHYRDLKEGVFKLLIRLMENDPIAQYTANGVLDIVIDLNNDLIPTNAEKITIEFQQKLVKAFSAAVELYLRHYSMKHVNAIVEERKKALLDTTGSFTNLNRQDDIDIEYASEMALQASRRFTSDLTAFREFFQRFVHCATAAGKAYNKDASGFFAEIVEAFQGLEHKFKGEWFDALFMLRNQVQKAPDIMQKVIAIQTVLATKTTSYDWKFLYGAFDILGDLILQIHDKEVLDAALFGQAATGIDTTAAESLGLAKETAALSAAVAQSVNPRFPGVADFLEFNGYVDKAFKITDSDRKSDRAIRAKAKELCILLGQKLYLKSEGSKKLREHKLANGKTILQIVGNSILTNPKMHRLVMPIAEFQKEEASCSHFTEAHRSIVSTTTISSTATKREGLSDFHEAVIKGSFESVQKFVSQNSQNKEFLDLKSKQGNTALIMAVTSVHNKIFELLFDAGANPCITDGNGQNAMHWAAETGNIEIVQLLLGNKQLLDSKTNAGYTPLMLAAQRSHLKVCEMLLQAGANPLAADVYGCNVMHQAASDGKTDIVHLLSAHRQLLDSKAIYGQTPLMLAAQEGHLQVCEILLKAGADILAKDVDGRNAMHFAARTGKHEIIPVLFIHKSLIDLKDKNGSTPFMYAAQGGSLAACEALLKAGANPLLTNKYLFSAMHWAAKEGKTTIVRLLLAYPELIDKEDYKGNTPLMCAAYGGHLEAFELLLTAGADPRATNDDGHTVMHWAVYKGKESIIRSLLAYPELIDKYDTDGNTPLMLAADQGQLETCRILLKEGADPTAINEEGESALFFAAGSGNDEIVKLLLDNDPLNFLFENKNNYAPALMFAAHRGHLRVCQVLLKAEADPLKTNSEGLNTIHIAVRGGKIEIVRLFFDRELIASKTKNGSTSLMLAAQEGHQDIFEALLKEGADPLATNEDGWSTMHWAAVAGKVKIVQMLRVHKQLIDLRDKRDVTPLILAAQEGHSDVCELLLKAGANPFATSESSMNAMHTAAVAGKVKIVQMLVVHKQLIDSKTKNSRTPLMLAAQEGHRDVCEALLKAGAGPLVTDEDGVNAMHIAATYEQTNIIQLLATDKQLIDSKNKKGHTPLMLVTMQGNLELCELLLKAGANPSVTDKKGANAMHWAANSGKTEIVRLLLAFKQLIDSKIKEGHTPLFLAAERRHLEVCEALLKAGASPLVTAEDGSNVMHMAAKGGKVEIIQMFLVHKKLIDARNKSGFTPIMFAALNGHEEVFKVLLKAGANPLVTDENGRTAMHYAAQNGRTNIVELLTIHKELINAKAKLGITPFWLAAGNGQLESCQALLKAGANVEICDPMHIAARFGKAEIVQILIVYKQLINSRDKSGTTPLMQAARGGHVEACKILLKAGADPLLTDNDGWNAMYYAAWKGKADIVQMLSVHKDLIDSTTKSGTTPLMTAAEQGYREVCEALLKAGANPSMKDQNGQNAMRMAEKKGKAEIVKMLTEHRH